VKRTGFESVFAVTELNTLLLLLEGFCAWENEGLVVLAGAVPKEKGAGVGVGALSVFCPKEKGEGFVVEFCPNVKDEGEEEGLFGRGIEEGLVCWPKLKLVLVEGLLRVLELFIVCPKLLNKLLFVEEGLGVPKLNVDEGVLYIEVVADAEAVGLLFPKPKGEAGMDGDELGFVVVEDDVLKPKLLLPKL